MKALVVEDEKPAARQIKSLLEQITPKIEVLKVIDNVEDLTSILALNPAVDLIISDIQLGDGLSFDAYEQFDNVPPIIFTTAYDDYAIKAFKTNSIDYLVKPIEREGLQFAVSKLLKQQSPSQPDFSAILSALKTSSPTNILVQKGEKIIAIAPADIQAIYTANRLVYLLTQQDKFVITQSLDEMQNQLPEADFFRINRQALVAKKSIVSAEPTLDNGLKLTLSKSSEIDLKVSRRRVGEFKGWWVC